MSREAQDRMVRAQKRILRAKIGYGDYRAAQRAWMRARAAQRREWDRRLQELQGR